VKTLTIIKKSLIYILLVGGIIIMILPFIWMLSTSLKRAGATMVFPPKFIPNPLDFSNYVNIFKEFPMLVFLRNSVAVAILTTVGTLLVATMAGYAFGRMEFRGRDKLFLVYLATMMIPSQVTMIPQFILLKNMGWLDSYQGLILPNIFGVFAVFLMRQAFMGLPKELDESASLDGANHLRICFEILMPLIKPTLAILTIFTFMSSWNNYLWPLIITSDKNMATLPLGLAMLQGQYATNWNLVMAGVIISIVPILVVYLIAQKSFIQGMTMSGMKE
jgi:multiple sugar transport system permease protein